MGEGSCRVDDHFDGAARAWLNEALRRVEADANRSADTHLHVFPLPSPRPTSHACSGCRS